MDSIALVEPITAAQPAKESKKRKRNAEASRELEVDINAPEPPSKKTLRKAKKGKTSVAVAVTTPTDFPSKSTPTTDGAALAPKATDSAGEQPAPFKRSEHGIWIGNLAYTTTKDDLRTFFSKTADISEDSITRIHIPPPADPSSSRHKSSPQNKGFAYVDFSNADAVAGALTLSETLLAGRKVLIKDAHDFEGRPEKKKDEDAEDGGNTRARPPGKPPNKRIFVGNLWFNTEKSDLEEHFAQCGEVLDIHIATFEDSGKCKGYAWVTFAEIEAAEAAVRGYIMKKNADEDDEEGDESEDGEPTTVPDEKAKKKKPKERKWWVNKVRGRQLRMEFAEDATVRYKKRFGKDAPARTNGNGAPAEEEASTPRNDAPVVDALDAKPNLRQRDPNRQHRPARKVDARNVKPGAALAAAPRLTGGIVASQGKKVTFD
ncbi:MAG: hypothetical protein Q9209_000586 [Squamulea sp. 1 TL-2023]